MSYAKIYLSILCSVFRGDPRYSVLLLLREVITTSAG
jgi:hypothetical protein